MINIHGEKYREVRCYHCKNFIVYEKDAIGTLAYQCPKCGNFNKIKLTALKTKSNFDKMKKYMIQPRKGGENIGRHN